jgi:RNA polymerase sigma-70 factor (ECF subfamily)
MAPKSDPDEPLKPLDPAVEAALVENHRAFLRFLTRRLGSVQEAEDLLQEFYLRALGKAHGIRASESVVAWLYRVLGSILADHYRSRERRGRHEAAYAREQTVQTEWRDADLHAAVCQCLYSLLPTLRPEYAALLWRIDLMGEQREQIAKNLGLTIGNLAVRLHRSRQALKRALLLSCETCPEHGFLDCACDLPARRLSASTSA